MRDHAERPRDTPSAASLTVGGRASIGRPRTATTASADRETSDVDLTYVLTTLRRAWWLLALAAALGTMAAMLVNATSAVTYQAQVQQFVSIADSSDNQS